MPTAAVLSRMLGYMTRGMRDSGHVADDADAEILVACAGYLDFLTGEFLPSEDGDTDAVPEAESVGLRADVAKLRTLLGQLERRLEGQGTEGA